MKEVSIPKPSALWDKYQGFPVYYLRQQWFFNRNIMTSPKETGETREDKIIAWVYVMVLTELLKTRKNWDDKLHKPGPQGGV